MEVDARRVLDVARERVVEQIHEHRLAASHVAVHIQAFGEVGRGAHRVRASAASEDGAEEALLFRLE